MPGKSLREKSVKYRPHEVPYHVWIITAILFSAVIAFSHALPDGVETREVLVKNFNPAGLERLSAGDAGTGYPGVVVIGTCLTAYALFFDEDMERLAAQNGFGKLKFVNFSTGGARLDDFISLLDLIRQARPQFLFLESNLFGIAAPRENNSRTKLRLFMKEMFVSVMWNAGRRQAVSDAPEDKLVPQEEARHQTNFDFAVYRAGKKNIGLKPFSLPREYEALFKDLQSNGSKIVLLDMPRSAMAISAYNPGFLDEMRRLIGLYQGSYGLLHWESPDMPDLDNYYDFVHLNAKGRTAYSLWFLSELKKHSKGFAH